MRDTRESRVLLLLLITISFALITVDIRGGDDSPLDATKRGAAAALGPVENGVATVVDPVGNAIEAVRESGDRHDKIAELQRQNAALKQQLGSDDRNRARAAELDKILNTAGAGRYGIKGAQVIAIGAAQGLSWTVTIDAGSRDGLERDMTVLNGDGLVGRITTVGPSTATVLLANDPDFTVGTRLEKTSELGFATGQGDRPMKVELLNGKLKVEKGDRLVTFGSNESRPFVPGVPIGVVSSVEPVGDVTRTVYVDPYASFTRLDIVGVVVQPPRDDPRDAVLPPAPKATPTPTVTVTVPPGGEGEADGGAAEGEADAGAGAGAGEDPAADPAAGAPAAGEDVN
ncbi:rod shape-determining protein MreC [Streptomyces sp. CMB-StM0423]|uniref:rod shape-determining protein MreC n=1 Tax=Streptomyces sp. CMB-StM0423 TaxID=2059884 RepID=UPI000C706741|nr:rod shape-determining protein MreC [Streptomyces sp. CMB-StM0423]AUH43012.1 rod shape-determining protein MreC [Streptomyces sp. CMB-StM0423]